jgi:nickel/cobalt transporter (NicO) family protein
MGAAVLLVLAAVAVAVVHSVLPDHWVPIAVVGRTQRWPLTRVARVSALASAGHVLASLVLAGVVALIGLRFQEQIETQQGRIVGGVLIVAGLGFLLWDLLRRGRRKHDHRGHDHPSRADHGHSHEHGVEEGTWVARLRNLGVPIGVAASPDLTILPIALAAGAYGVGVVGFVLAAFALFTMATFVVLTVLATAAGYQVRGRWLEEHGNAITSVVLIVIGAVAFAGL